MTNVKPVRLNKIIFFLKMTRRYICKNGCEALPLAVLAKYVKKRQQIWKIVPG